MIFIDLDNVVYYIQRDAERIRSVGPRGDTVRNVATSIQAPFQIRFRSLVRSGCDFVFPCDASGCVEMDALSDAARNDYLYARAMVGRELAPPAVVSPAFH